MNERTIQIVFDHLGKKREDFQISVDSTYKRGYRLVRKGERVEIAYSNKSYLVMALGELLSSPQKTDYEKTQALCTKRLGVFGDCARNNVPTIETLKKFAVNIALMGYNHLQLYMEDCIELDGEPYFGYMRGRFTKAEIKELDAFCRELGVELTPCLQTLAHLGNIFRHATYQDVNDCNDILLVDEQKTYALIEKLFAFVKECFTSNRVNIGMDEAHMLGAGKYLDRFGYKERRLIIREHLQKVMVLAKKYELDVSLFSDMFFRVLLDGDYYDDKEVIKAMPDSIRKIVPQDATLVYWDYYHVRQAPYEHMLALHKQLTDKVLFAGGAWKWQGFSPFNRYTCETVFPALSACKKYEIDDILLTSWGDDGGECPVTALLGAYAVCAAKCYEQPVDEKETDELLRLISGYSKDELFALDLPNIIVEREFNRSNPCKYLFFDDLLIGLYADKSDENTANAYRLNAERLYPLTKRESAYSYLFETAYTLCRFLEEKGALAREIRTAYENGDKAFLESVVNKRLPELEIRLKAFYRNFKKQWEKESKPFGFEVQDSRIGGLLLRFEHVKERIENYLSTGEKIAELEAQFLPTDDNFIPSIIEAKKVITPSQIS